MMGTEIKTINMCADLFQFLIDISMKLIHFLFTVKSSRHPCLIGYDDHLISVII